MIVACAAVQYTYVVLAAADHFSNVSSIDRTQHSVTLCNLPVSQKGRPTMSLLRRCRLPLKPYCSEHVCQEELFLSTCIWIDKQFIL